MKSITLIIMLVMSFASMAGNFTYNRLHRLYEQDPWKCVRVSERYMSRTPDKASPYYFASAVYREKSKKHGEIKTRYMMMSKSLRYATKFEELEDLDLMTRVNWGAYVLLLREDADALIMELDSNDLSGLSESLGKKNEHLAYLHNAILIVDVEPSVSTTVVADNVTVTNEQVAIENHESAGYFGLASGNEVAPSYNKIQEQELLKLINEERKELFMSPLKWDESLARAARYHATDMAQQDYFMHESYDRIDGQLVEISDAETRIRRFEDKDRVYAENIAAGSMTAKSALLKWIGNDADYDVMFDESNRSVGIGIAYDPNSAYGYYWVLVVSGRE